MSTSKFRNTQLTAQRSVSAPSKTRRNFLRQSARAGLGLGLLCMTDALIFGQSTGRTATAKNGYFAVPQEALNALKRSDFARYNGDYFAAADDFGKPVGLNLFKIEDLRSQTDLFAKGKLTESQQAQLREESFSLIFRGPLNLPLRQRTYSMKHYALGNLEMFLVPVGKDGGGRYYEAVFNRSMLII